MAESDVGALRLTWPQPVGVLYRPPASKMKNVKQKDYLGKAVGLNLLRCYSTDVYI